jgi:hypothetical protein
MKKLVEFLQANSFDPAATYLLPVYGLGDKLRFFSYLHHFESVNRSKPLIITVSGADFDPLQFYPELWAQNRLEVPATSIPNDEELLTYIWRNQPMFPRRSSIFPLWHHAYMNRALSIWENLKSPDISHELAVKQVLNIPAAANPRQISIPSDALKPKSNRVIIAPYCNSSAHIDEGTWLSLCDLMERRGLVPVVNSNKGPRVASQPHHFEILEKKYEALRCGLTELIELASSSRGIVAMKSGLGDVFSLTTIPCLTLSHKKISPFWKCNNRYGKYREVLVEDLTTDGFLFNLRQIGIVD